MKKVLLREDVIELLIETGELLEGGFISPPKYKSTHGNCCTCPTCHYYHSDCVCSNNWWIKKLDEITFECE